MIGIIAVGTAVRDVFAKRTAQARAPPTVEIVLLRYILRVIVKGSPAERLRSFGLPAFSRFCHPHCLPRPFNVPPGCLKVFANTILTFLN